MSFTDPVTQGVIGRTDQGVDWSAVRGNIVAVAGGTITNIYRNLSGFGTTVIERIKGSPPVYYAGETGAGAPVVRVGQRVRAGQEITPGLGMGGIEIGYWNAQTGRALGYAPGVQSGGVTRAGLAFRSRIGSTVNVPNYVPPQYVKWVQSAATGTGLPASVVAAQIQDESGFNPNAKSKAGAQGMAQFEPGTWKSYGHGSPFNPNDARRAYIAYMSQLLKQYNGNIRDALAAYNAGPHNISAGYGYADTILSAANIPQYSTASGAKQPIVRPGGGGGGGGKSSDTGEGVKNLFAAYEAELNTPRGPAPVSGFAPPKAGMSISAPFQWWWQSFTGNWEAEQGLTPPDTGGGGGHRRRGGGRPRTVVRRIRR